MDAGMMENQAQTNIKSFKQAVDDKIVKVDNFDMDEKVAIVDNTLCNLVKLRLDFIRNVSFGRLIKFNLDHLVRWRFSSTNRFHQPLSTRPEFSRRRLYKVLLARYFEDC